MLFVNNAFYYLLGTLTSGIFDNIIHGKDKIQSLRFCVTVKKWYDFCLPNSVTFPKNYIYISWHNLTMSIPMKQSFCSTAF